MIELFKNPRFILKIGICGLLILLSACSNGEEEGGEVTGKTLYNNNCLSCHGEIMDTKLEISLKERIKSKKVEDIEKSILTPPTGMPKMVNESDANMLAEWLYEQYHQ